MKILSKLKLSDMTPSKMIASPEDRLRHKMLGALEEQIAAAKADKDGKEFVKRTPRFVTDADTRRIGAAWYLLDGVRGSAQRLGKSDARVRRKVQLDTVHPGARDLDLKGEVRAAGHAGADVGDLDVAIGRSEAVPVRDPSVTDTDELLRDAGYSAEEIERLRDAGTIA